jgi:hypothetical protein
MPARSPSGGFTATSTSIANQAGVSCFTAWPPGTTGFFFYRGKRLGRATGWHGLGQFEAAVAAAREKIRVANAAGSATHGEKNGKSSAD